MVLNSCQIPCLKLLVDRVLVEVIESCPVTPLCFILTRFYDIFCLHFYLFSKRMNLIERKKVYVLLTNVGATDIQIYNRHNHVQTTVS